MTAAIGIVGSIGLTAFIPALAKRFFAVKEHQPIDELWFLLACGQYSSQLEQRPNRGSWVVRANKPHVLVGLRFVVTANDDHVLRLARYLSSDVDHLFWAERS